MENGGNVDLSYWYELESDDPVMIDKINNNLVIPNFEGELERDPGISIGIYDIYPGTLKPVDGENFDADKWEVEYEEGQLTIMASPVNPGDPFPTNP